jgi:RNA polymerase sigma-70 factor (ECF subfamily)
MEDSPVPLTPELLHAQRDWVRGVARALVADPGLAEDLEQQVWVKALEHPPQIRRSVRAWLGTVLRNAAADLRRAAGLRDRHERGASSREATVPAAGDVVAEAEALRLVVDAVLALREPYRTTLLLRFYEDLAPAAIARRLDVPLETVRTRLRRGMVELRESLDEGRGGRRRDWMAALLPLVHPRGPGTPPIPFGLRDPGAWSGADRAARDAAATLREVTTMGIRVILVSLLSLSLVGGVAWWAFRQGPASGATEPEKTRPALPAFPADPSSPRPQVAGKGTLPPAPPRGGDPSGAAKEGEKAAEGVTGREEAIERLRKAREALQTLGYVGADGKAAPPSPAVKDLAVAKVPEVLENLSKAELLERLNAEARTPSWQRKGEVDLDRGMRIVGLLLAQNLEPAERSTVLVDEAILHRFGPQADPVREEAALREATGIQSEDTPEGREARFQLAWNRSLRGDDREAMDLFDKVASHPSTEPGPRATSRWEAAVRADRLGDRENARRWYEAFVAENDGNAGKWFQDCCARARERLKALE